MKQLPWILTVLVAASTAQIGLADEANKDKNAVLEALKSNSTAAGISVLSAGAAYATSSIEIYKEGRGSAMNAELKERDILAKTDEMLKKAGTLDKNLPIEKNARIALLGKHPIVEIHTEVPNEAAAQISDTLKAAAEPKNKLGKLGAVISAAISNKQTGVITNEIKDARGREYFVRQINELKANEAMKTPAAYVTSARLRAANRIFKVGALMAGGVLATNLFLDHNSLDQVSGEIKSCAENKDGSIICDNAGAAKRKPAASNESGGIVLNGQNAANSK